MNVHHGYKASPLSPGERVGVRASVNSIPAYTFGGHSTPFNSSGSCFGSSG